MEKNTKTLAKYLLTKGIESSLKIQKMLFFFHVEEYLNGDLYDSFFMEKDNFEAWIYGPVNVESFKFMQQFFSGEAEKEEFLLSKEDIKTIDKKYGKYFDKYSYLTSSELVEKSHKNLAWINARGDLNPDDVCNTHLKEDDTFTKFKN